MKNKAIKYLNNLVTDSTPKAEIDLITYIKKCVRETAEPTGKAGTVDLTPFFVKLWSMYPRKVGKQGAYKTFCKLFKGLNEEEVRKKANAVYLLQRKYVQECIDTNREMQYIQHYQTWLNANVPLPQKKWK